MYVIIYLFKYNLQKLRMKHDKLSSQVFLCCQLQVEIKLCIAIILESALFCVCIISLFLSSDTVKQSNLSIIHRVVFRAVLL